MFGQNPLKDVDSRVFTRMLRKDGWKEGRKDGSVTISLRNFVGEEIIVSLKLSNHTKKYTQTGNIIELTMVVCFVNSGYAITLKN